MPTVDWSTIDAIRGAYQPDPFTVLGPHVIDVNGNQVLAIRVFQPYARAVTILMDGQETTREYPTERLTDDGYFEAILPNRDTVPRYRLRITPWEGEAYEIHDPYAFPLILSDYDIYLIGEGNHLRIYEKLGAHLIEMEGVRGVAFAVWAPNAERVSVIGNWNRWDGRVNPMRQRDNGIWEIFIPDLDEGARYKYEIKSRFAGWMAEKTDPYGVYTELRPGTASIVFDLDKYEWGDAEWLAGRAAANALDAPIAIYEVHLGSWRRVPEEGGRFLTYRELAHQLVDYVKPMGYTHIELLPVAEHPLDASWGYQVLAYYAPTSRFGTPADFMYFVDHCHRNGIGVFLDWVPGHFPKDISGLNYFDGTHLYEHADPRLGEHQDWGTLIFNYGRNEVRNFLLGNALYWLDTYHIDGLRVDAVASMLYLDYSRNEGEWLPNIYGGRENLEALAFLRRFNELTHTEHPGTVTMAEESTAWPMVSRPTYLGGLGFDMKWNMGWMNDMLVYMSKEPIHRRYHHNLLTFSLMYAFSENFILPLSHDEVVHGKHSLIYKMPGDLWQKFANLRAFFGYMYGHPGKKLLFMGSEFAQFREWNAAESLDWHLLAYPFHRGVQQFVHDLNQLYRREPALHEVDFNWEGFEWIDFRDVDRSILAFIRWAEDKTEPLIFVSNFTPVSREGYRVGVPRLGFYKELINSDAEAYGGGNIGNTGGLPADDIPWQGQPASILITAPPLATVILKPTS
ncbi:MAG TPA: 1,4-alpha-glucan branching enzyme [Chloroflexi bacterium]|nr:1,4-alpha-glucan branching enzyme [Chloroflexota bacterium]